MGPRGDSWTRARSQSQSSPSPGAAHKSQSFGTGANADQKHFPLEAANVWICQVREQQDCAGSAAFGWQQLVQTQDVNYQPCKLSVRKSLSLSTSSWHIRRAGGWYPLPPPASTTLSLGSLTFLHVLPEQDAHPG